MEADRFVFAGGGTGGHLFPGLAVARALRIRRPAAELTFLTTTRDLDVQLLAGTGFRQVRQSVRPFSPRPWRWPAFWWCWQASVLAAERLFRGARPAAVLGLGGYAAGPGVVAARGLGIRTAILNPDAIPGRANRYLSRYADLVVAQWEVSRSHFPLSAAVRALGCPIRAEFGQAASRDGHRLFGLDPARPVVLATGASQGARTLNLALARIWRDFHAAHPEWQLLHLSGIAEEAATRSAHAGAAGVTVVPFTHEMAAALAAADVVVSRAGASTLAELTALGKPAILLPYPYHRDRHQHANANVLVDVGAAILIEDAKDAEQNAGPLRAALERLADGPTRVAMAQAATRLARPRAAEAVAGWLLGV